MSKQMEFLIAHENKTGGSPAQAMIVARSENEARELFKQEFPERVIVTTGVKGSA